MSQQKLFSPTRFKSALECPLLSRRASSGSEINQFTFAVGCTGTSTGVSGSKDNIVIVTRRFLARPSAVSFELTGVFGPCPTAVMQLSSTPFSIKSLATVLARTADSSQWMENRILNRQIISKPFHLNHDCHSSAPRNSLSVGLNRTGRASPCAKSKLAFISIATPRLVWVTFDLAFAPMLQDQQDVLRRWSYAHARLRNGSRWFGSDGNRLDDAGLIQLRIGDDSRCSNSRTKAFKNG